MRYLIIERLDIKGQESPLWRRLDEEESLNKFKEIWYSGVEGHAIDNDGWDYPTFTDQAWEEYSKTL